MKPLARAVLGLAVSAFVGSACSKEVSTDAASTGDIREVTQAISGAAMTWPTTWTPIRLDGVNLSDPTKDAQGSRDIVGTAASPAAYVATDANRIFFRMRLGDSPLKTPTSLDPFGWACALDVDANHQTYEFIVNANGIVTGDEVSLSQNTVQGTLDSPADKAEVTLQTYSALVDNAKNATPAHARVLAAGTNLGGNGADVFIDWSADLNDFPVSFNPLTTPFRLVCGSSSNAQNISSDPLSPSGATTLTDLVSDPVLCGPSGCVAACLADSDCGSAQFCNTQTNVCASKLTNGTAIPTIANHTPVLNATCSVPVGAAVCISAVCDTTDNLCGFANGNGSCTPANAATVCRSGACSAGGVCVAPGACTVDSPDCAASQFCNTGSSTCVAKLANGTPIPTIANHTPVLNGTCSGPVGTSVCTSAVCDTTDNRCGFANGNGTCTTINAATLCRGGACSPNANTCMPVGGCVVDADCPSTSYCDNSVFSCTPKLVNGAGIPTLAGHTPPLTGTCTVGAGTAVCAAAVCDTTDDKCGFANGNGTCTVVTGPVVCRAGACGSDNTCGKVDGEACTLPTECRSGGCNALTCGPPVDGGTGTDAGLDGSPDADVDVDAGADADVDASVTDGGTDADVDASVTDGGADADVDASVTDAGLDASDGGTDGAVADAGRDSGSADASATDGGVGRDASTVPGSDSGATPDDGILEGGGIACSVRSTATTGVDLTGWFLGVVGLAWLARRRRPV